jgi:type II secretory ATPase GspE/PulE/Tfp pilus assembly ATPase PilB-like protein
MLAMPICFNGFRLGVVEIINKIDGDYFTPEEGELAEQIAKVLGKPLYNRHRSSAHDRRSGLDRRMFDDIKYIGPEKRSSVDRRMGRDRRRRERRKLDHLVESHLITREELGKAFFAANSEGLDIEQVLLAQYEIEKQDLGEALGDFYKTRYISFDDSTPIPGDLLRNLKSSYLRSNFWVPLAKRNGTITVLMDDPNHLIKRDMVFSLLKTNNIEFCVGLKEDILQFLDYFYGSPLEQASIEEIIRETEEEEELVAEDEIVTETDSAIVQFVNKMIYDARKKRASDIHIESQPGKHTTEIRFRIDGACTPYQTVPYQHKRALVSRLKIMANMNIAEKRLPQDGKIQFKRFGGEDMELRVATLPITAGVEDVSLRILDSGGLISLEMLGFNDIILNRFKQLIEMPYGVVLVVGPTGSGKTTTLHAALAHINLPESRILTAEDPVEITQKGLRQLQIQPKIGLTFASAMRSFLRCDPDVIMVGEMRDQETARIAIEASLTGHLVFSTLHTNNSAETVTRLLDMGIDSFNFADAVLGILAQRLVRTLCEDCRESLHPTEEESNNLAREYGEEEFTHLKIDDAANLALYTAKGCDKCNNTGYHGRIAIFELLVGSDEVKRLIQLQRPTGEVHEQAKKEGMVTLKQDGILKIFQGITDLAEVRKVCIK